MANTVKSKPTKTAAAKGRAKSANTKSRRTATNSVSFFSLQNRTFVVGLVFVLAIGMIGAYQIKQSRAATPNYHCMSKTLSHGSRGDCVRMLQAILNVESYGYGDIFVDGIFGTQSTNAVRAFQANRRIGADGIVGPNTWNRLCNGQGLESGVYRSYAYPRDAACRY